MAEIKRIYDLMAYDVELDTTPQNELVLIVDHHSFDEPKKVAWPFNQSQTDVLLGSQLLSSTGWTSTGWTGNYTDGFTHTAGNTNVLSNTIASIIDKIYQITITVTGRTAGSFTVAFGGETTTAYTDTTVFSLTATTNDNLEITPTSDFDGTITIGIKELVWELTEAEILAILGVPDVVTSSTLAGYVTVVSGKSLIADTEIARLLTLKQNIYTLTLNASSDVATRLVGLIEGTDYPTGWTLAASSSVDLLVTHTLTGRKIVDVKVYEIDGTEERLAKPFSDAYSGILGDGLTVLIEGLDTLAVDLRIELIFN